MHATVNRIRRKNRSYLSSTNEFRKEWFKEKS